MKLGPPGFGPPPPPPPSGGGFNLFKKSAIPSHLKPKKKWTVEGPTKRANWKTISPHKISTKSIWTTIEEEKIASDDILSGISNRFSSKPVRQLTRDSVDHNKPNSKKNIDVKVIDGKAAQNLSILLGGPLKHLTHAQIKSSILRCDTKILTPNVLQLLKQYLPPPKDLARLVEMKENGEQLVAVEEFVANIGDIKRLSNRLESLHFIHTMPDLMQDIKPDIVAAISTCEEIKSSQKFARILELILLVGNYMNSGSKNEVAYGFELSFLTKLTNTKDAENKQTLLHYIVEVIESKFPDVLYFYEDISQIDKASRISQENIKKTVKTLKTSLKNVENDLSSSKKPQSEEDSFHEIIKEFIGGARQQIEILDKMVSQMDKLYKDLSEFLCFDTNKYSMEDLFMDLKQFKDAFITAHQDNVKEREIAEKNRRAKLAREQHEREMQERLMKKNMTFINIDANHNQEGVMDSLLEALQTGSAFGNREKRKRGSRPAGAERRAQLNRSRSRTGLVVSNYTNSREINNNPLIMH